MTLFDDNGLLIEEKYNIHPHPDLTPFRWVSIEKMSEAERAKELVRIRQHFEWAARELHLARVENLERFQRALALEHCVFKGADEVRSFLQAHAKAWERNSNDPPISLCEASALIARALAAFARLPSNHRSEPAAQPLQGNHSVLERAVFDQPRGTGARCEDEPQPKE